MTTINFVPNDYIQQRQSSRVNFLYLTLLAAILGSIGATFSVIKMRQRSVQSELNDLNVKMTQAKEQIVQLEQLKDRGKTMIKNMVMTADLLEPVPRSVILASLTNSLPSGVSLLEVFLDEKEIKSAAAKPDTKTQYQSQKKAAPASKTAAAAPAPEVKTTTNVTIEIEGLAPSDIEVAGFIANLSGSLILNNVELVQSKEFDKDGIKFRQFRLRSLLKSNLTLTKEDIAQIRKKKEETI